MTDLDVTLHSKNPYSVLLPSPCETVANAVVLLSTCH